MSSKKSVAATAAEETTEETTTATEETSETAATEETTESAEESTETTEESTETTETTEGTESSTTEPVAYVGPNIKHVAQSGTVYIGDLPAALTAKIEEIPAIKGLLIPVSKLSTAGAAAKKSGTALNNLYLAVAAKLK